MEEREIFRLFCGICSVFRRKSLPVSTSVEEFFHGKQPGLRKNPWPVVSPHGFPVGERDHSHLMATASQLLDSTNAAIAGLLASLADTACQEYQLPDGRRVRRAEFATTLTALQTLRAALNREVALQNRGGKVRLGRIVRR